MTQGERILVVDDNLTNRKILAGSLGKAGYTILEASDGLEAVGLASELQPDIVLLDVSMPGLDGFEVCELLKASEATQATPVIFLTALTGANDIERAFAVGGSDYVTKPFHMAEVKARVRVHLALRRTADELERQHTQLLRAQKLESVGQLAAGIAHEINTPTQYVAKLADAVADGRATPEDGVTLRDALTASESTFVIEQVPEAIEQALDGVTRVSRIVSAMKHFSHPGTEGISRVDLNRAIESTVTVASNEWKYVADVDLELDPDLPPVPCIPGELNQVILNLVVNGAHAIADMVGDGQNGKGKIVVRTSVVGSDVEIRISDTGGGIPEDIRDRIFDPFFTTKEVGQGTGQGLAIAHDVIVGKHGGKLWFETESRVGTTFIARVPLDAPSEQEEAA